MLRLSQPGATIIRFRLLLLAAFLLSACTESPDPAPRESATAATPVPVAFVGSEACRDCHAEAYASWRGSHHELAMQAANATTVLGDFDGQVLDHQGEVTRFTGGRETPAIVALDARGREVEHSPTHVFGIEPLQQQVITFPDGRLQVTTVAWDTRPAEDGGQRWFDVYPEGPVPHDHPTHWTGELQNWNSQCAECHVTGFEKRFDADSGGYDSRWTELGVGCEACHGRGARHVHWAQDPEHHADLYDDRGLEVQLAAERRWIPQPETGIARREPALDDNLLPEACGRCHARRGATTDHYRFGANLLATHRPALIERDRYFPDGQILDEVYVWGSFLQSRMYRAGVTCTDCHDPHTARVKAVGDQVCAQCHLPSRFAATEHTRHDAGDAGCLDCHMPERTYMAIDERGDHSFPVPRPDLSVALGTPNACTGCHGEQGDAWAAAALAEWFPDGRSGQPHFATALADAWAGSAGVAPGLIAVATDRAESPIVRASALAALRDQPLDPVALGAVQQALADPEPLLRFGALQALEQVAPNTAVPLAAPLLNDPIKVLRIAAARAVAPADGQLPEPLQAHFDRASAELEAADRYNFDREDGQFRFANFLLARGQAERARQAYLRGLDRYPDSVLLTVNLADALRILDRDGEAIERLEQARERAPEAAPVREALALAYVRMVRHEEAVVELRRLVALQPDSPRAGVLLVLALEQTGAAAEAAAGLAALRERFPQDPMVNSVRLGEER